MPHLAKLALLLKKKTPWQLLKKQLAHKLFDLTITSFSLKILPKLLNDSEQMVNIFQSYRQSSSQIR